MEKETEEFTKIIIDYLESENNDLESAVNFAINYSKENSIFSDFLFKQ